MLGRLAPHVEEQPGLKIVTNAGGMNPPACAAQAAKEVLGEGGHRGPARSAWCRGDDLLPRLDELIAAGHTLNHLDTGEPLATVRDAVVSANAYLGAAPIAEALGAGRASSSPAAWRMRR